METPLRLRSMTLPEFRHWSLFGYEGFIQGCADASGEPIESVRARVGGPPGEPTPDDLWYVAEHADADIGYCWIRLLPGGTEAFGFDVHLHEAARGRGLGRALMLEGRKLLRDRGIRKLKICVFSGNTPARRLYESLGFRETGFRPAKKQHEMEIEL